MNILFGVLVLGAAGLTTLPRVDPPAKAPGSVLPEANAAIAESARPVLERARAVLTGAKTAQGSMKMSLRVKYEHAAPYELEGVTTYAVAAPDRFYLRDPDGTEVFMDDKALTVTRAGSHQFVQRTAPAAEALRDTVREVSGGRIKSLPVYRVALTPKCSLEEFVGAKRRVTGIRAGEWKGTPGTWVLSTAEDRKRATDDPPSFIETFYADSDGLPRFFRIDHTEQAKADNIRDYREDHPDIKLSQLDHVTSAVWEVDVSDVKLNAEIPPERFVFKPGTRDRKVEAFEPQSDEEQRRPPTKK